MPKSLAKPWSRERKEQDDIINNEELVRIVTGTPAEERERKKEQEKDIILKEMNSSAGRHCYLLQ
jgi:Ca2+-binding EF-hand superfamily protein